LFRKRKTNVEVVKGKLVARKKDTRYRQKSGRKALAKSFHLNSSPFLECGMMWLSPLRLHVALLWWFGDNRET
jgi:hypothetical protein